MSRLPNPAETRPTTASRHEKLHAALLDAAERTIAAEGLAALRARVLAEAVGCSVGAIYTIFADLDAVILAVNTRTLAQIATVLGPDTGAHNPVEQLVALASAYLDYASANRPRWAALFLHAMAEGRSAPDWYARQQEAAFSHIEAPLARLCPRLTAAACSLLARSLFASVHGMVALGLDEKVAAMPLPVLRAQIATVVTATARGLVG